MLVFAATGVVARLVPAFHTRDAAALRAFTQLDGRRVAPVAHAFVGSLGALPFTLVGIVLVAVALIRRRRRLALGVVIVLVGSTLSAEVLKPALAVPSYAAMIGSTRIPAASWPSGHSTAAMALVLCAVMVAPRRLRTVVAIAGALFAVAVAFSLLTLDWHLPSDVLGGYLLAAVWALLVLAAVRGADARAGAGAVSRARAHVARALPLERGLGPVLPTVLVAVLAAVAGLAMAAVRAGGGAALGQHSLLVAGAAIAGLAAALSVGLARLLR
jgi:membrane-associated phospholipid phosphatase